MSGNDTPPRAVRRWTRYLLIGSLALNLLILGAVAGFLVRGGPGIGPRDARDPVAPYTRALTETQRDDLRRSLRRNFLVEDRETRTERRAGILEDYRDALTTLRADPFDPDPLRVVLDRQSARGEDRRRKGQEALAQYLAGLSSEERKAFADRLEQEISRFGKHRDRAADER
ncbi:periplasmic heavy metal sensor [Cognatishimia sp. F0-27]|uniref:periplasmic heavy metal sensor n=1 Tax=Cognatishimia sp. F0-27 TaxID=2816855 RepID=UPI001D0C06F0|nr:periplasmic heavy metal sensor [Cognatishimia sp. F0-27]MCC1492179.1 periplasmic heavy metal sensor [Cognatishimia sp. F0-27]